MTNITGKDKLSIRQILSSTLAAAFGVQNSSALERDFSKGQPFQFIVAGILFVIVFIAVIFIIIHWILSL